MVCGTGAVSGTVSNIGRGTANFYPQSRYLLNLAYLRLKSLTFGYTLPADITKKALTHRPPSTSRPTTWPTSTTA